MHSVSSWPRIHSDCTIKTTVSQIHHEVHYSSAGGPQMQYKLITSDMVMDMSPVHQVWPKPSCKAQ